MLKRFLKHIKEENFFGQNKSVLLAISGGIDSMCLFHLMLNSKIQFSVAHFDHHTRSGESLKDAEFVKTICATYNIKFHLSSMDDNYKLNNFQAEARRQRYLFFNSLNYDVIVTAHHYDDDTETILMNFLQGKSLNGINAKSLNLVRPLLDFTKQEIEDYVCSEKIEFRQDESNFNNKYLRNVVRNKVTPILYGSLPEFASRIKALSKRINKQRNLLITLVIDVLKPNHSNGNIFLEKKNLENKNISGSELLEIYLNFFDFNDSQAKDIYSSRDSVGASFRSHSHELIVDRDDLILRPLKENQTEVYHVESSHHFPLEFKMGDYLFTFSINKEGVFDKSNCVFQCNLEKVKFPLKLRYWENGDKFQPLGMNGKTKSLKKLFTDLKLNLFDKQSQPILCNGDGEIMWVCNIRQDERFKIDENAKSSLRVTCIKSS